MSTDHAATGNIFVREVPLLRAGSCIDGHAHNFDHMTYCVRGAARIERGTQRVDMQAGEWALIEAGVVHRITALADDTLCHCIYSHRTPQGDVVQRATGWREAYE
jgi:quercetin dioxygenase-like cupin family protein